MHWFVEQLVLCRSVLCPVAVQLLCAGLGCSWGPEPKHVDQNADGVAGSSIYAQIYLNQ